mmetsp:Transcript_26572/g.55143  ORF Transcript_26572/g.55143 Transcript_26572/m.55143 type:complete len:180 (+) Transcript_26572:53-592(+)
MAVSRRSSGIGLPVVFIVAALSGLQAWSGAFLATFRRSATLGVARAARGGQTEAPEPRPLQPPEVNYFTNQAIMGCLNDGCPIEVLDDLEGKLSRDEARIAASVQELRAAQASSPTPANVAEVLGWLRNVLSNSRSLREQLQSAREARHGLHGMHFASQFVNRGKFAEQFTKGNTVAFP